MNHELRELAIAAMKSLREAKESVSRTLSTLLKLEEERTNAK